MARSRQPHCLAGFARFRRTVLSCTRRSTGCQLVSRTERKAGSQRTHELLISCAGEKPRNSAARLVFTSLADEPAIKTSSAQSRRLKTPSATHHHGDSGANIMPAMRGTGQIHWRAKGNLSGAQKSDQDGSSSRHKVRGRRAIRMRARCRGDDNSRHEEKGRTCKPSLR